jgi:hypothetical protein
MSDKRYDRIVGLFRKSYPNCCILWIVEIINIELEEIEFQRGFCEEVKLFHGTKESIINIIANKGFDPRQVLMEMELILPEMPHIVTITHL